MAVTTERPLKGYNIFEIQVGESSLQLSSTAQGTGADHAEQTHVVKFSILSMRVENETQLHERPI